MDIEPVGPDAAIGEDDRAAEYRVRIWTRPAAEGYSWMVDEWDVRDAPNVVAVIDWAESEAKGRPIEIFVTWSERSFPRRGGTEDMPRMTRIYGAPGDENTTTETILFTPANARTPRHHEAPN